MSGSVLFSKGKVLISKAKVQLGLVCMMKSSQDSPAMRKGR